MVLMCVLYTYSKLVSFAVRVDTSRPQGGVVHTGTGSERDASYSSDITTVAAAWEGFYDYESGIVEYLVTVQLKSADSESFEDIYSESFDASVSEITWTHFSFSTNDSIRIRVRAVNGARRTTDVHSGPYMIDLSPPDLVYLVDGFDQHQDLAYQSDSEQLNISWDAHDLESHIHSLHVSVWEMTEGRRRIIFPDPSISGQSSFELSDTTFGTYTLSGLALTHGAKYITVLTLTNGAGLVSEYESSGVTIDLTPPEVSRVEVEGELTVSQETNTIELAVIGTSSLSVRWSAADFESGVAEILVGVVNENDSFVSPSLLRYEGYSSGGVVEGLELSVGGFYRVAVVAVNNAGSASETAYSHEFR